MSHFNLEEARVLKWLADSGGMLSRTDMRRKANPKEVWALYDAALGRLLKKGKVSEHVDPTEGLEHPGPKTRWYTLTSLA